MRQAQKMAGSGASTSMLLHARRVVQLQDKKDPTMRQAQKMAGSGASASMLLQTRRVVQLQDENDPLLILAQKTSKPGASASMQLKALQFVKRQDKMDPRLIRARKLLKPGAPASTQMVMCTVLKLQDEKDPHMIQAQAAYPRLGPSALLVRYREIKKGVGEIVAGDPAAERRRLFEDDGSYKGSVLDMGVKPRNRLFKLAQLTPEDKARFRKQRQRQYNKRYKESMHLGMKPGKKAKV